MRVFIAGSRRITRLPRDVLQRLDNIFAKEYQVLIGDANGVDRLVQKYANQKAYRNVRVYCVNGQCRNNVGAWEVVSVSLEAKRRDFRYYASKDEAMVKDADYGFLIWDGRSRGTLRNAVDLVTHQKRLLLFHSPRKRFHTVTSRNDLDHLIESVSVVQSTDPGRQQEAVQGTLDC